MCWMRLNRHEAHQPERPRIIIHRHLLYHFAGLELLEARPAAVGVRAALGVVALGEHAALQGGELEAVGLVFLQGVEVVEALEEQQVGDLLDDFERVGNAAGPERIPEGVDLAADSAVEHERGKGGGKGGRGRPTGRESWGQFCAWRTLAMADWKGLQSPPSFAHAKGHGGIERGFTGANKCRRC